MFVCVCVCVWGTGEALVGDSDSVKMGKVQTEKSADPHQAALEVQRSKSL